MKMSAAEQKKEIETAGKHPIFSYNQTDFVKDDCVEVSSEVLVCRYDLFVKHMAFYIGNAIDVGVEILPMKSYRPRCPPGLVLRRRVVQPHPGRRACQPYAVLIGVTP